MEIWKYSKYENEILLYIVYISPQNQLHFGWVRLCNFEYDYLRGKNPWEWLILKSFWGRPKRQEVIRDKETAPLDFPQWLSLIRKIFPERFHLRAIVLSENCFTKASINPSGLFLRIDNRNIYFILGTFKILSDFFTIYK